MTHEIKTVFGAAAGWPQKLDFLDDTAHQRVWNAVRASPCNGIADFKLTGCRHVSAAEKRPRPSRGAPNQRRPRAEGSASPPHCEFRCVRWSWTVSTTAAGDLWAYRSMPIGSARRAAGDSAVHRIAQPALHDLAVGQLDAQRGLEPRHAAREPEVTATIVPESSSDSGSSGSSDA